MARRRSRGPRERPESHESHESHEPLQPRQAPRTRRGAHTRIDEGGGQPVAKARSGRKPPRPRRGPTARKERPESTQRRVTRQTAIEQRTLAFRTRRSIGEAISGLPTFGKRVAAWTGLVVGSVLAFVILLAIMVWGVNTASRMVAEQRGGVRAAEEVRAQQSKENVLLIAVEDGRAKGFLALRIDDSQDRIFAIAIPEGAFVEVPGQGFEKIAESYQAGGEVSKAAIANYLSVPFERYASIPASAYRAAISKQDLSHALDDVLETDMDSQQVKTVRKAFGAIKSANVAIAPLPVRQISVGEEKYLEPQREEIADLLQSWWGVKPGAQNDRPTVIIYNGSGVPGVAGTVARKLIQAGYRVVDTRNADRFDYTTTQILIYDTDELTARRLAEVLGVGKVMRGSSDQRLADIIVIIGKDLAPSKKDG